jgi:hypothetical protein
MGQKALAKVLILGSKGGVGFDSDEEATLKVDEGIEVGKDQMDGLGRDDGAVGLESAHVGLKVLQILDKATLGLEDLIDDLGTVISGLGWVRVTLGASCTEQTLVLHAIQHHAHSFNDLFSAKKKKRDEMNIISNNMIVVYSTDNYFMYGWMNV